MSFRYYLTEGKVFPKEYKPKLLKQLLVDQYGPKIFISSGADKVKNIKGISDEDFESKIRKLNDITIKSLSVIKAPNDYSGQLSVFKVTFNYNKQRYTEWIKLGLDPAKFKGHAFEKKASKLESEEMQGILSKLKIQEHHILRKTKYNPSLLN